MKTMKMLTGKNDVVLKNIEQRDLADMAILANDPGIAANLRDSFPSPYALKDAEEFYTLIQEGKIDHAWGIYVKEKIAGVITLTPQTDIYHHSAEIGYWLGAPFRGKGVMTEAVSLLTAYAFNELPIRRIYAGVFASNPASEQVLLKSGFHREAVKINAIIKNGVLHDEHLMVIMNI